MNKRRVIVIIISASILTILLITGSLAWYKYRSKRDATINFTVNGLNLTMTGAEEVSGSLIPRSTMTDTNNIIHNFSITSTNGDILDNNIDLGIYLDIINMDTALADKSFKWSLYKNGKELSSGNFLTKSAGDRIKINSSSVFNYDSDLYDTSTFQMLDVDACISTIGNENLCNGGYDSDFPMKLKDDFNDRRIFYNYGEKLLNANIISIEKYPTGKLIYEYWDTSTFQMLDQNKCITFMNGFVGDGAGEALCNDNLAAQIKNFNGITNDLVSQNIISIERKKEEYYVLEDGCIGMYSEKYCSFNESFYSVGLLYDLQAGNVTTSDLIANNVIASELAVDKYESVNDYTLYIWIDGNMDNPYEMLEAKRNFTFKLYADVTQIGGGTNE